MNKKNSDPNQLIYKINGKEYLLVGRDLQDYNEEYVALAEIGAIEQDQTFISGGALGRDRWHVSLLVPCENIAKYMKIING